MGAYLVHEESGIRGRASGLLADVLARLVEEGVALTPSSAHHLCAFFVKRLADYPSVGPCLRALLSLFRMTGATSAEDVTVTLKELFKELHVPALEQGLRQAAFDLLSYVLEEPLYREARHSMAEDLANGVVNAMEGEKDPRCLLTCLGLAECILREFGDSGEIGEVVEEIFDVTACYYPITFTPPPNDPYGITREQLVSALRSVFVASKVLAPHVVPLLLEKLEATSEDVKLDSLDHLSVCSASYGAKVMLPHLRAISDALQRELRAQQDGSVSDAVLEAVTTLTRTVATHREATGEPAGWGALVDPLLMNCLGEIKKAPESMLGRTSGRAVCAVAKACPYSQRLVLRECFKDLQALFEATPASTSPAAALLDVFLGLVRATDPLVGHSAGSVPLAPYVAALFEMFGQVLAAAHGDAGADAWDTAASDSAAGGAAGGAGGDASNALSSTVALDMRCSAVEGLVLCATRPVNELLTKAQVADIVARLNRILVGPSSPGRLRVAALHGLVVLAKRRAEYRDLVLESTVPTLLEFLPAESASGPAVLDGDLAGAVDTDTFTTASAVQGLVQLCSVHEIFIAVVPQLLRRAVGSVDGTLQLSSNSMVLLPGLARIVEADCVNAAGADFCVMGDTDADGTTELRAAFTILRVVADVAVAQPASAPAKPLVDAAEAVLRAASRHASDEVHAILRDHVVDLFLGGGSAAVTGFAPLSAGAPVSQTALIRLLTAVVGCMRKRSEIVRLREIATAALNAIVAVRDTPLVEGDALAASQVLAALVNVARDDDVGGLSETVAQRLTGVAGDASRSESDRQNAQVGFAWALKGLAMRPGTVAEPLIDSLCSIVVDETAPFAHRKAAARSFETVVSDSDVVLNRACNARISMVFKQRFFVCVVGKLAPAVRGREGQPAAARLPSLFAVCAMLPHIPETLLLESLDEVLPAILQAVTLDDADVVFAATRALDVVMAHSAEAVATHLPTLVPTLLSLSQFPGRPKIRYLALSCLVHLTALPYHKLHPHKRDVFTGLAGAVDDPRRLVRSVAVDARNRWALLSS